MSAKAIREYDGKLILNYHLSKSPNVPPPSHPPRLVQITIQAVDSGTQTPLGQTSIDGQLQDQFAHLESNYPWIREKKLVVKPDQLIKRRGKSNLILLNADWDQVKLWISERAGKSIEISDIRGRLTHFLVEPFVEHGKQEECYVCIRTVREGDEILWCKEGGVDIGDVDSKANRYLIPINTQVEASTIVKEVAVTDHVASFLVRLHQVFVKCHFTYLEINPLVVTSNNQCIVLDLAAKLDQTAEFECSQHWNVANIRKDWKLGPTTSTTASSLIEFPPPFGRDSTPEEAYIAELDSKTGASLKLTILNPKGFIWTMVAGGGASVAYADAICAAGFGDELANYGEYSGAPSETQTYDYAKTILDLMTRSKSDKGKVLFIGGGIANFTNVAGTFKGIIRALKEYQTKLQQHNTRIFVRRGGPNWQEGLRMMREVGDLLGIPLRVFGPDTHITAIVPLALLNQGEEGGENVLTQSSPAMTSTSTFSSLLRPESPGDALSTGSSPVKGGSLAKQRTCIRDSSVPSEQFEPSTPSFSVVKSPWELFTKSTRCFVWGMQAKAVQGMLDFDYLSKRQTPSVAALIYPFSGSEHVQKFYWGTQEIMITVYCSLNAAIKAHPDADTVVNFASCRSVLETTKECIETGSIRTVAIIAEGVPERHTRELIQLANAKKVTLIGPATVGGLRAGVFRIGNTAGMVDNLIASRLYRPGSVSYVSRSGGMSNELNHIISRCSDGVCEGIAIGGDRHPGSSFLDHILRFQADPSCKVIVVLGEVGGGEEYAIVKALMERRITKPLVAWCIGTCTEVLGHGQEVQFGHAGAVASAQSETATAKNAALRQVHE